jgi:hypothetical protein
MKTFYFNTGVRPGASPLYGKQIWKDGTKQIPFDVEDVPENASLMFLCNNPELPESKISCVIVREVFNTDMCSKYAYFRSL